MRHNVDAPAPVRTRKRRKQVREPVISTDQKPITNPQGGYVHVARELADPPTNEELERVNLRGKWPPGEIPLIVTYGRRLQVVGLMLRGEPDSGIVMFCERAFLMSRTMTRSMISEVRKSWQEDYEYQRSSARVDAINRVRRDLSELRGAPKRDYMAINRHEKLLSELEGTAQPVKVAVLDVGATVRDALTKVMGELSDADLLAYMETTGEQIP